MSVVQRVQNPRERNRSEMLPGAHRGFGAARRGRFLPHFGRDCGRSNEAETDERVGTAGASVWALIQWQGPARGARYSRSGNLKTKSRTSHDLGVDDYGVRSRT